MASNPKPGISRPANSTLKNLPWEDLDALWDMKYPEDKETQAMTLEQIVAILPARFGKTLGKSALSQFYLWLDTARRIRTRENLALQVMEEMAKDPAIPNQTIKNAGQRIFLAEGVVDRDVRTFVSMVGLENEEERKKQKDRELDIREEANRINREKLSEAGKSKIEAGLDALFAEIKGNPKAEKLFAELKAVVAKS
jgi:hypothetical protein